ncbi:MAG: transcription-repair coupling factor, partial [Proteobacteria bacterium]|nr:transcription-repair coupling factor [Pseudomonadota bacterium]
MDELLHLLESGCKLINATGLRGSSGAFIGAQAADNTGQSILFVLPSERQAELAAVDLRLFTDLPVIHYPAFDIPPYTPLSPDQVTVAERLSVLYRLLTSDGPLILVASCESLLRRVIPKNNLSQAVELVMSGEEIDQHGLVRNLTANGYESVPLVQSVGDFSIRGGIIDIFAPGYDSPLRLDFFGDTVESLRSFEPISQRSLAELNEADILPASNILLPAPDSEESKKFRSRLQTAAESLNWPADGVSIIWEKVSSGQRFPGIEFLLPLFYDEAPACPCPMDYLPENTIVFIADPDEIKRSVQLTWERIQANYKEALASNVPALLPETVFISEEALQEKLAPFTQVKMSDFAAEEDSDKHSTVHFTSGNHKLLRQEIELQRKKQGLLIPLADRIREWQSQNGLVVLACRSQRHANHLSELLGHHQVDSHVQAGYLKMSSLARTGDDEPLLLVDQPLSEGFDLIIPGQRQLHVLSENELFGERRLGPRKKARAVAGQAVRFDELQLEDIVVHSQHGLGIYGGLVTLTLPDITNDFLQINYRDNDKLYVPVDRINSVSKYKGISDKKPKLDKLGGKSWFNTKRKVKEEVWEVARDLLKLYAKRELQKGRSFSPPGDLFHELEESFPFDETAGQQKAIDEALEDLTSEKIMDRLVCGDVGYGKTEVAVRAAFKVIEDGYQVAMLVPTTVLAEQHAETFQNRLQGFPVLIDRINRFRSQAEQKRILKKLKNGELDVIIGTHRLLSKDIEFKKLGLLIVDEEHRFGVSHKEKIKRLRAEVNILTLTATPIPRTMQMSLLGIRDLSVISTPPEHRRPVKTFVARYDDLVIKEAITRELQRGGQTFLVHNRVRTIQEMARKVQKLAPQAKVAVAHGQMPGKNLEEIMVRFINKEVDVLVCTTIIESGLDISNANTIIITRADRLGLAEIYQLRGRVGRSSEQSYAYLLVPSLDGLAKDAKERLRALLDYSELGGGFKLAMSDLQIRGGGNILGVSQSGHISAVGFDLYLELLQNTVAELKQKSARQAVVELVEPEINLHISAYIPEQYIVDTGQRYIAYRKIGDLQKEEELLDLQDEFKDRYGELPEETLNLFDIMSLKIKLRKILVTKLEQGKDTLIFSFHEKTPIEPQKILSLVENAQDDCRFTPDGRLMVT